ncbi:MAG: NAD-glutamate dehydrogenase [Streptosporangiaceae bacterium]|jgi:glutamate dehydrogenase
MSDKAGEEKDNDILLADATRAAAGASADVGDVSGYLQAYFRHVAIDDLAAAGPGRIAAIAIEQARFAAHRSQGRALVRIGPGTAIDPARDVISIVTDDMPFLVDSILMELGRHHLIPRLVVHPQLRVKRDVAGALHEVLGVVDGSEADHDEIAESWTHIEIARLDETEAEGLEEDLQRILGDVRVAVEDYPRMQAKAVLLADELAVSGASRPPADETGDLPDAEVEALLRWLADDHFTFLGYREYDLEDGPDGLCLRAIAGSGLGVLRHDKHGSSSFAALPPEVRARAREPKRLVLTKANSRSTVHRATYLDYVSVKRIDSANQVTGEYRFLGLYTHSAYTESITRIPVLRRRLTRVLESAGLTADSHDGKDMAEVLESYPREELFQTGAAALIPIAAGVLRLRERRQTRLFLRKDIYGRYMSCLVYLPRDRYTTRVRLRAQDILRTALNGTQVDYSVMIGESPVARVQIVVRVPRGRLVPDVAAAELERKIAAVVRSWDDDFAAEATRQLGEQRARALIAMCGKAIPETYKTDVPASAAVSDLEMILRLRESGGTAAFELWESESFVGGMPVKHANGSGASSSSVGGGSSAGRGGSSPVGGGSSAGGGGSSAVGGGSGGGSSAGGGGSSAVGGGSGAVGGGSGAVGGRRVWRLTIYRSGSPITLTDVLPRLQHMGLDVVDEHPYEFSTAEPFWIYDFGLRRKRPGSDAGTGGQGGTSRVPASVDAVKVLFEDALGALWRGDIEDDGFNALVVEAHLSWQQVMVLRAYAKYLRQTGSTFSQDYVEQVLAANITVTRLLVRLFESRFDPDRRHGEVERSEAIAEEIRGELDEVASLDQDRILRAYFGLIRATLRTNHFQGRQGEQPPYFVVKLDAARVPDLPAPRPKFELFVYSPRLEGVHLRFGDVARGGLRWSDRREDFRTEILGLAKAQEVKNSVIVPSGAKGGFVCKQLGDPGDREAYQAEVLASYQMFISAMLDVTDNLVAAQIVPPSGVVRHDRNDPYLVVAADKGTATFSDTANEIAIKRGFWLGDAFASGGSEGYDHKKMGITARGAWESVKFHFQTLGTNVEDTEFTVVGIGDMSGDVFGNGMLLSKHIKLVAAFDHRHLFVDPDPDPAASFAERARLFALPRSSWNDYDESLISGGGGVWPRSAKSVPVTPEMQAVLGIAESVTALAPDQLISAILAAPVDLLWNGGIGTYVKGTTQTQADADDRSNDAVRIDASQLRARVVGEGGNLGLTQEARIEFALSGGLVNTDFIDNSAGVDTSDHEVNIKILLDGAVRGDELSRAGRNELLHEMTDEVGHLVLQHNYQQNRALAAARAQASSMLHVHSRYIRKLERDRQGRRSLDVLPGDKEVAERRSAGTGLTAPEFSVLLAQTKIAAAQEILDSRLPDDPFLRGALTKYFPIPLQERFARRMGSHPLHREIITTAVVNDMVDRSGITFLFRINEETGASVPDTTAAWLVARAVFDMPGFWAQVEALDGKVDTAVQILLALEGRKLTERATRWLLHSRRASFDIQETVDFMAGGVVTVAAGIPKLLIGRDLAGFDERKDSFTSRGVPGELAERVAAMVPAYSAFDIVDTAAGIGRSVEETTEVYFDLADRLQITRLRDRITALPRDERWNTMARAALRDDLYTAHAAMTRDVLMVTGPGSPEERLAAWTERNDSAVRRATQTLTEIWESDAFTVATLSVAVRAIRTLVATSTLPG